jgi:hypothetical protein
MILHCRRCRRPLEPRLDSGRRAVWCGPDCHSAARKESTQARHDARMAEFRAALDSWHSAQVA